MFSNSSSATLLRAGVLLCDTCALPIRDVRHGLVAFPTNRGYDLVHKGACDPGTPR